VNKVEVVDYQNSWIDLYKAEVDILTNSIGFLNPGIHHIGSTSVSGLSAKPIIDILIEVDEIRCLDDQVKHLEAIGYRGRGENGIQVADTSRRVVMTGRIKYMRLKEAAMALYAI